MVKIIVRPRITKLLICLIIAEFLVSIFGQDNKVIDETVRQRLNILAIVTCDGGHLTSMAGILTALHERDHNIVAILTNECPQKRLESTNLTRSTKKLLIKNWVNINVNSESGNFQFIMGFEKLLASQNTILREGLQDYLNNEGREEQFDVVIIDLLLHGAMIECEVQGLPTIINSPFLGVGEYIADRILLNQDASLYIHCYVAFTQLVFRNFLLWIQQTMLYENLPGAESMQRENIFELGARYPTIIQGSPLFFPAAGSELRHVYIGANRNLDNYPPLSHEIKDWISGDTKDIIYISFGTHTIYTKKEIIEFVNLLKEKSSKYRFIWGVTNSIKDILDGLMIDTHTLFYEVFLPQVALLNEKLVKIFITHGGINSVFDAIMMEKPVICIPGFGDQAENCETIHMLKLGIQITSFLEFTNIFLAIDQIGEHKEFYGKNIKRMKKSFEDTGEYDAMEEFVSEVAREKWMAQPVDFPLQSLSFYIAYYILVGLIAGVAFGIPLLILWIVFYCCTRKKTKSD